MKKQILFGIGAAALAGVMCLGFAACGPEDPKDMVGEELTAQQWTAALAEENLKNVKIESVGTQTEDGVSITDYATLIIAGNLTYFYAHSDMEEEGSMEQYTSTAEDGTVTVYVKDEDGKWTVSDDEVNIAGETIKMMINAYFSFEYEDFEYSEEENGYVAKDENGMHSGYVLKFKGGKLAGIVVEQEMFGMHVTGSVSFTYGGQHVTLPKVAD